MEENAQLEGKDAISSKKGDANQVNNTNHPNVRHVLLPFPQEAM